MRQDSDIIDFDELDAVMGASSFGKSSGRKTREKQTANDEDEVDTKPKRIVSKSADIEKIKDTASASTSAMARKKIEYYIKKSPHYKDIENQITILTEELNGYYAIGRKDLAEKTKILISDLSQTKKKFVKYFKEVNYKKEKENADEVIKNSPLIKALKEKVSQLKNEYRAINTNSILSELIDLRKMLKMNDSIDASEPETQEVIDFDDLDDVDLSTKSLTINQRYSNLLYTISDLVGESASDLNEMSSSQIKKLLIEAEQTDSINDLKKELEDTQYLLSSEMNKIKGYEDITDIVFKIFDFETEEAAPKELLGAANIPYVKGIAYKMCSSTNMMHNYEDAVGYGLLGLSLALDKWYNIQKLKDNSVSFSGFASIYISNAIKKGMWELSSGGMISKSSMATFAHKRQKYVDAFVSSNPDLKDIPEELINNIVEGMMGDAPGHVHTESTYTSIVGGEEGDTGDIWSNANASQDNMSEAKLEYEDLLKSIQALFTLFEVKVEKNTGIKKITNKKIFDKFDYKLFKLVFGFEFKRDGSINDASTNSKYTQAEIASILSEYMRSEGIPMDKDMSQPAINYRIEQLYKKLKLAVDSYPEIKKGFDYLWTYAQAENSTANLLSNANEELGIKMDREILSEMYNDNASEMSKKLTDGKTLSDIYQLSSNNPLDEEIAETFRNVF